MDFSQNVLQQIFGVYRLNIDNASNVSQTNTKIKMTFAKEDAFAVRELLIRGRSGLDGFNLGEDGAQEDAAQGPGEKKDPSGKCIRIEVLDLLLMGLLKSKGVFFFQMIAVVTTVTAMLNVSTELLSGFIGDFIFEVGIGIGIVIMLGFLLALLCGMAGSLIRYYGFTIMDNGEAVKIEYGLLTKKRYTIQKNRISGFSYGQSFLMRILGTGTLQLFAIGYGPGDEEDGGMVVHFADVVLLADEADTGERAVMADILPQMTEETAYTGAAKGSLRYFFYGFGFILALALLGASVYCSINVEHCQQLWIVGLLIGFYSVAGRIQEYKNTGISGNTENISLTFGGFQKTSIFIKTTHVESISAGGSILKEKKGIASITVSYIAPLASANQRVKNVPAETFEYIKEMLIY